MLLSGYALGINKLNAEPRLRHHVRGVRRVLAQGEARKEEAQQLDRAPARPHRRVALLREPQQLADDGRRRVAERGRHRAEGVQHAEGRHARVAPVGAQDGQHARQQRLQNNSLRNNTRAPTHQRVCGRATHASRRVLRSRPTVHASHADMPSSGWKLPAAHLVHASCPGCPLYVPGAHAVDIADPTEQNEPDGQTTH